MTWSWLLKPLRRPIAYLRNTRIVTAWLSHRPVVDRRTCDGILWSRLAWSRSWRPCCLKCTSAEVVPMQARRERVAFVAGGTAVRAQHVFVRCAGCKDYKYILTGEFEKRTGGNFG
ncbi:MAG: hypothetical protein HY716_04265 [Planctomycetes bacterium]|nr:hypothetical protein [Planctomycetota bacterium]